MGLSADTGVLGISYDIYSGITCGCFTGKFVVDMFSCSAANSCKKVSQEFQKWQETITYENIR
jgi:hypothetical protein